MTDTKIISLAIVVALVALFIAAFSISRTPPTFGSAPSGLPATVGTSSLMAVGTTQGIIFATSTCAARIISTPGTSGIMLTFDDSKGAVPTGTLGIWQAASTTVTYDSGQYGCGAVRAFSFAAQNLTVTETR